MIGLFFCEFNTFIQKQAGNPIVTYIFEANKLVHTTFIEMQSVLS